MWATKKTRLKSKNSKHLITEGAKIIMLSFLISTLRFMPASALTSQSTTGFQFSFNSSLSISLSSADLVIPHLTPGNYANSNTITVNVSTNNSYGYTLMAKVGDKNNPNLANNNLVNTDNMANNIFTSLATSDDIVLPSFSDSKWGYTTAPIIDTSTTTYSGLLYGIDTIINATKTSTGIPMNNTYPGTNTTNFTIAAKAGDSQASGEYTNVINFRGVANINTDVTINDLRYMQDIAKLDDIERQLVISSMTTGTTYQLQDSRDNMTYNIAKLKDGNIWLLDNLALGSENAMTLTSADTNMADDTTFALPASVSTGFGNYTVAQINTGSKNTDVILAMGQNGTGKAGVRYNYCAATAGTICLDNTHVVDDAQYDICPKGWRMPTGGTGGEYQILREQYSSDAEFAIGLRLLLSGEFSGSKNYYMNTDGPYWSSTSRRDLSGSNYRLLAQTSTINTVDRNGGRRGGYAVRCIYDATPDMQNVTTSELATLMPNVGDTAMLNDNRDGSVYSIGRLADGKYWMLDNLALGSTSAITLTNANTNMTAASWTLPASTTTGFDSSTGHTTAAINAGSKSDIQPLAIGQSGTGKVGVYYNFCAAAAGTHCSTDSASTNNVTSDICPKGWRLPSGFAPNEFQALRNQYSSDGAFALALRTPLSGHFYNGSDNYRGYAGNFWTSTYASETSAHDLYVYQQGIDFYFPDPSEYGYSVRCLKK